MEFKSTEKRAMVYETLKNIETAITRLQERTVQIHTADDFLLRLLVWRNLMRPVWYSLLWEKQ